jgi:dihydropteroate synthase
MTHRFTPWEWSLAHGRALTLGNESVIMGILNATPDSFSDGGRFLDPGKAIEAARQMAAAGARIIDIGGESTRPGAEPVNAETEQARILPIIRALAHEPDLLLSVDTYRAETARLAVDAGAHILNDVWGLQRDPAMAAVAADTGAGLVIMHTGRERQRAEDVMEDQFTFLGQSLQIAETAGVRHEQIVLDPGFGFAKDTGENMELIARFIELHDLGYPLLVGASRKRFIGTVTGRDVDERDAATAATSVLLRLQGASIFRVHDVPTNRDALIIADAMLAQQAEQQDDEDPA